MKKLFFAVLIFFISCGEEDNQPEENDQPDEITNEILLAGENQKTWMMTKYQGGNPIACVRDNELVFRSDKTYSNLETGEICTPGYGETGSWVFINDSMINKSPENSLSIAYTIITLNDSTLNWKYTLGMQTRTEVYQKKK